ncbi:MAG TPA: LysR family transcriptional regulator [Trebonia sp.]|nr:LysR family transcriptional regulator [Trebonia sp.]
MTLTQLNAFVLVARLGSVRAAATALGVSESAVSQALTALRQDLGDQLITRGQAGMTLTPGGARLLGTATQIVVLGAEAHAAVRAAQGAPEQLRIVATPTFAEFVAAPLMEAFTRRYAATIEVTTGVAPSGDHAVLIANRLADVAFGPGIAVDSPPASGGGRPQGAAAAIVSEPVFKYRLAVVTAGAPGGSARVTRLPGNPREWRWLVGPSGADAGSSTARLLTRLGIPEGNVRVLPSQTAAWAAAADGGGVAPAIEHLVTHQVRRGELALVEMAGVPSEEIWHATLLDRDHRTGATSALRRFLATPEALQLIRSPVAGVPPSRFKPPVYVTIWS